MKNARDLCVWFYDPEEAGDDRVHIYNEKGLRLRKKVERLVET